MMDLMKERRKKSGMTQWQLSDRSGVNRMRLSLAETGQIELSAQEEQALRRTLDEYISARASEIAALSQEGGPR